MKSKAPQLHLEYRFYKLLGSHGELFGRPFTRGIYIYIVCWLHWSPRPVRVRFFICRSFGFGLICVYAIRPGQIVESHLWLDLLPCCSEPCKMCVG